MIQLADARRIITAAEKKAEEIGQPMNVAVVDEGGNLIAFERMANAWLGSIDIAQKKAWTTFDGRQSDGLSIWMLPVGLSNDH
jgi:uncharacterized protein GlcG (DUF336 family)